MSGPALFDTSVFIQIVRGRMPPDAVIKPLAAGRAYLSSVVAHELWAGVETRQDVGDMKWLLSAFDRVGAIITPAHEDWVLAGRLLVQYQRVYGTMDIRHHSHDVLIVLCAAQVGGTVMTANLRHMDRWARLARRAGRSMRVELM